MCDIPSEATVWRVEMQDAISLGTACCDVAFIRDTGSVAQDCTQIVGRNPALRAKTNKRDRTGTGLSKHPPTAHGATDKMKLWMSANLRPPSRGTRLRRRWHEAF